MSRSATPAAKRSNATFETSKMTPSAELTIGTAIWPSLGRLRTAANSCENGCEHKRNVERTHPQPQTPTDQLWPAAIQPGHEGKAP